MGANDRLFVNGEVAVPDGKPTIDHHMGSRSWWRKDQRRHWIVLGPRGGDALQRVKGNVGATTGSENPYIVPFQRRSATDGSKAQSVTRRHEPIAPRTDP